MVNIVRPGGVGTQGRAEVSGSAAGRGQIAIGQTIQGVGRQTQQSNQLGLAKQVSALVDAQGRQIFEDSKRAHQSAVLLNKMTEATEVFIQAQQGRYAQQVDENGNPMFTSLHTDIGEIGDEILNKVSGTIIDPEVANRFKQQFGSYVSNQKISALKRARHQQVEFGRVSLNKGLEGLVSQGSTDDIDQLKSYEQQGITALQEALAGGLISPEEHEARKEAFTKLLREGSIKNLILNDKGRAALLLSQSAEELGISEADHQQYLKILEAAVKADAADAARAAEIQSIDQVTEEASIVEDLEAKIEAGAIREDELLAMENRISTSKFNKLKKKFIKQAEKQAKKHKELKALGLKIVNGEDLSTEKPAKINEFFDYMVKQREDGTGKPATLSEQAILAATIGVPVTNFAKKLEHAVKFGKGDNAAEVLAAYTYIKDRKRATLESQFDKDARLVMEQTELLVERAGLTPVEALSQAREKVLEDNDATREIRSKLFNMEDVFKVKNIEETAASELDTESLLGDNRITPDAVHLFKELAREGYIKTGDKAAAIAYAKSLMNETHGFSEVGGSKRYMFAPPEKFFPQFSSEELRRVLMTEITGRLPEGANPETVSIIADNATVGQVGAGGVRVPSWAVTYIKEIDGEEIELPVINEETGQPLRWTPQGTQVFEQERAATIEAAKQQRQEFITNIEKIGEGDEQRLEDIKEDLKPTEGDLNQSSLESSTLGTAIDRAAGGNANPKIKQAITANSDVLSKYGINNQIRLKMFLSQMAHESAGFKALVEQRSDASAEAKYGAGTRIGKNLGNTQPGDGAKYKGRGIIQLTGRFNYEKYGRLIGVDLVNNPELAADPEIAVEIAAAFWQDKGLNELADQGRFNAITKRINGGFNGLKDRQRRFRKLANMEL